MNDKKLFLNLLALITVVIWSATFISSKILLNTFTPLEVMFYRFVIAYFLLLIIHPKFHKIDSLKEELMFLLSGIAGGSLYFLTENSAVKISQVSNVGLIVATAPIITALLAHFFTKNEKLNKNLFLGFVIAISGVILVMFNGSFMLKLNPIGDILALCAAVSWSVYSIITKKLGSKYNPLYLTRKIFFYALLTMIPFLFTSEFNFDISKLLTFEIMSNLLFLGIVASSICYVMWNFTVNKLGVVKTNNYIYLIPAITLILSVTILHEKITLYSGIGALLIFLGVYVSENGLNFNIFSNNRNSIQEKTLGA
ncbi:membrane protein [Clostridium gelidum]|uniref:Membrane protein n=1 Tax=Clostridium gelidum TaxID=704125 RepID=A0ABN6IV79_9CLOT|nr:DMT family transporter [Clostridium gelidum]BCZ46095.1 membrane protein [Clostridium gelidum]